MRTKAQITAAEDAVAKMMEERGGDIQAEELVVAATATSSPLHCLFEWDNSKAGHSFRVEQARQILRSIRVKIEQRGHTIVAPFYLRNPDLPPAEQGYTALPYLLTDKDRMRRVVVAELARAVGALTRASAVMSSGGYDTRKLQTLTAKVDAISVALSAEED